MSAPPGSPLYNWQIGLGATFTNGAQITGWTDQIAGKILNQIGTGSNTSYSTATGRITLPNNTAFGTSTAVTTTAQPTTIALLFKFNATNGSGQMFDISTNQALFQVSGSTQLLEYAGNNNFYAYTQDFLVHTFICVYNGASSKVFIDGVSQGVGNAGTSSFSGTFYVWATSAGTAMATSADIGSVLVYASDMSANAAAITTWLLNPSAGGVSAASAAAARRRQQSGILFPNERPRS